MRASKVTKQKQDTVGISIIDRIIQCDSTVGGTFSIITGSQGSGKTACMLTFVETFMITRPQDKIFFASTYFAPLQFMKLQKDSWNIMVEEGADITFHDRDHKMKQVDIPHTSFTSYEDCYNKALPGKCNAVFFKKRTQWMNFIHFIRKEVSDWTHIFIDELGDICPSFTSGKTFHNIGLFTKDCSEIRKSMITVMVNTQAKTDIDYRITKKIMIRISMPGAISGAHDRVWQQAIDNLKKDLIHGNEFYIEYDGQFGISTVCKIYEPIKGYNIQANIKEDDIDYE